MRAPTSLASITGACARDPGTPTRVRSPAPAPAPPSRNRPPRAVRRRRHTRWAGGGANVRGKPAGCARLSAAGNSPGPPAPPRRDARPSRRRHPSRPPGVCLGLGESSEREEGGRREDASGGSRRPRAAPVEAGRGRTRAAPAVLPPARRRPAPGAAHLPRPAPERPAANHSTAHVTSAACDDLIPGVG